MVELRLPGATWKMHPALRLLLTCPTVQLQSSEGSMGEQELELGPSTPLRGCIRAHRLVQVSLSGRGDSKACP